MTHTILLLTANPKETQPLDLASEVTEITQLLQHAKISEQFTVHSAFAMTPAELRIALLQHQPDIVHFSGHGTGADGIVLVDDNNKMQLVTTAALVDLFASFPKIQCVILNACYSALQASSLVEYVPFVIGMNQSILDRAALAFSSGFYQGLSVEKSIHEAFAWGCNEIALRNLGEQNKPVLKQRREFAQRFENLPFERNPHFTGRDTVLHELLETLHFHGAAALSGMGGMGKTQTALEFAYRYRHEYQAVLWCFADTAENLTLNLANLAITLQLPLQQKQEDNLKAVSEWLNTHEHWLLVVDNADELKLLKTWLPLWKRGKVVVTTRADVTEPYLKRVALREMQPLDAVNLLWERATDVEFDALRCDHATLTERFEAQQLAETLGYLPLALDQAGAYIRETQCSFARYLKLFEQYPLRLLAERGELQHDADHPDPVATTWLLSFKKVTHPLATQILYQCAFLHGDAIVQTLFAKLDPLEYDAAIREILRYSLLKREEQRGLLTMHRLVQTVLRAQLPEAEQHAVAGQVVTLLAAACPRDETDFTAWLQQCAEWLPNAREGARWIQQWQLQLEDAGALLNQMGYYLDEIGNFEQALTLFQEALEIDEQVYGRKVYGRNHPDVDVAIDLNNLAELYRAQGQYEEALPLYQEALTIYEQALGKQHPDYATSLNNLAELYGAQGQYDQALPLFQEALKIREHVLGKQHPDYATSLNNLANLYYSQGQYEQALPLYQEALKIREQVLGRQHPSYATSLNNLAELYRAQGQYEQALPLYQEALKIDEQVLGKQHPSYATSLNNLALLYDSQGQYEQALPLYQEALKIREQVLGKQHPSYATSLNNLAGLYDSQGNYEQALPLFQEASKIWGKVLGKQHPDYATSLNNLAELYRAQGQYEQALPLFQEALKIKEQVLGEQHPDYATSLNNLALLYDSQGQYEQALPLYQEALKIREQVLGRQHPSYATSLNNLAELYRAQGQYEQALPLYQEALKIDEQVYGRNHPDVATDLNNLAGLYDSQGQYEQALPLYQEALKIDEQVYGRNHPDVATDLNNLAGLYDSQGQYEQALPLYQEALKIFTKVLGEQHPSTQTVKENYLDCLSGAGGG